MVTYTSSSLYWSGLKPRIRVYALSDSTYSSALYTYNAFTDVGSSTKPVALSFDSQTTNVGSFSIEIEDADSELDPDLYMRGNRVFIECSKDGSVWQPAFKGLVRGTDQNIYAPTGRNLALNGYSYLVRLNERILNTIKESSLTGEDYNRTDSTMFTNNLINNLLSTNSNYIYSDDDTALYSIFKNNNITSSPITEWIPRLDAQFVTLSEAIESVLEFSNGLVMLNPTDDQLVLYNNDLVTSATGIFLITNQKQENADDADYTMYPLEPYRYNISYDYPDSGSRLIGSIGEAVGEQCPEEPPSPPAGLIANYYLAPNFVMSSGSQRMIAIAFLGTGIPIKGLSIPLKSVGNNSSGNVGIASLWNNSNVGGEGSPTSQIGSNMNLYKGGVPGTPFPSSSQFLFTISMAPGIIGPTPPEGDWCFLALRFPHSMNTSNMLEWITDAGPNSFDHTEGSIPPSGRDLAGYFSYSTNNGSSWTTPGTNNQLPGYVWPGQLSWIEWRYDFASGGQEACGGGGTQATKDADPVFAVAHDRNMSGRIGVVERAITNIPTHIKKRQTLVEYLGNLLYYAAKPRFVFDYPSVSMPNKVPKAGDIVMHVDRRAGVGTQNAAVQTGVIDSVSFDFAQGSDGVLALRKLALSTTGIKRGSY